MKKALSFAFLVLLIVTSYAAGTMAVYTRAVSQAEQISAKRYAFSADGEIANGGTAIRLAPTESMEFHFTLSNIGEADGKVAEVPLDFRVTVDFAQAAISMPGLTGTLFIGEEQIGESTDGQIHYTAQSAAGELFENEYTVVITWADDGANNDAQTAAGSSGESFSNGLTLTVSATQAIL